MILLLTINGNDKIGVNVIMSTIIYEGKELKVFSTARYKGRIYNILEPAKDISTADDFYFNAIAECKGKFYIVRWDYIGDSEIGFEDSADWEYLSDVEREIDFDDIYELDGKPIKKMILNKQEAKVNEKNTLLKQELITFQN